MPQQRTHRTQIQHDFKMIIMSRQSSVLSFIHMVLTHSKHYWRSLELKISGQRRVIADYCTSRDSPEGGLEVFERHNFVTDAHSRDNRRIPCWEAKAHRSKPASEEIACPMQLAGDPPLLYRVLVDRRKQLPQHSTGHKELKRGRKRPRQDALAGV